MKKEIGNAGELPKQQTLSRAWYGTSIDEFCSNSPDKIYGRLASNSEFAVEPTQRDAWLEQIVILKKALKGIDGNLFLEGTSGNHNLIHSKIK